MDDTQKIVIFDFDGTLANSIDLIFDLYNEHAKEFGYLPLKKTEFPALRRLGYRKAMKAKGVKWRVVPKMIAIVTKAMHKRMNEVVPYKGIVTMLENLQSKGYRIGVLTSNQAPLVTEFFRVHGFPEFDFVVSEKTLFGKDKALRKIMQRHDLSREQVIYVGDEPRDVSASRKAKVKVIAVSWGLGGTEGFEKDIPDALVSTPKELLKTILSF